MSDKKLFELYERLRSSGKYNMIMEADKAMEELKLRPCDYYYVMFNYEMLKRKYGDKIDPSKTN